MKTRSILIQCLAIMSIMLCIQSCNDSNEIIEEEVIKEEQNLDVTSEKNGFTINLVNQDPLLSQNITDVLIKTFHEVYPKMVEKYNKNAPKKITVVIVRYSNTVSYITNGVLKIGANWIKDNPNSTDVLVHELMHIVQAYPVGIPSWLKEGIADFVRDEFGINNTAAGWSLIAYSDGQTHSDSSQITASFLKWIESNYDDFFVKNIDKKLRDNNYSLELWEQFTGHSLNDLWVLYSGGTPANIISEKEGFTISIMNQNLLDASVINILINTFHESYPKMVAKYYPGRSHSVKVTIDKEYDGVAYAGSGGLVISAAWLQNHPKDTDLLVHEMMHLVQLYTHSVPGWLTEGIADYVRDEFGINNAASGWRLASYSSGQHYTNAYTVTGGFLKWIEANYDDTFVQKMDKNLRDGTYSLRLWIEYTDYRLDDLWLLYSGKVIPEGGDVDWTDTALIHVSTDNPNGPSSGEGSHMLIDGNEDSKFLFYSYDSSFWMEQEFLQAQIVNKYTLTSANDVPDRDPKNWRLTGSNDESTWVDLDTRSDEFFNDRKETKEYTFSSTTAYKYYRLFVTANAGASTFQLSEWHLVEVQ